MRGITFTAATAVTLVLGWLFIAPLFVDQTADERFALTMPDGRLNMVAIQALPDANRRLLKPRIMKIAAGIEQPANEAMPQQLLTARVLATGSFRDADRVHQGSGGAMLYQNSAGAHLLRLENFRTTNGPALVVYLSKHPDPTSAAEVLASEHIDLGKLKGNVGNQNYPIPAGTSLEGFESVVIWCELFDVLFATAALTPAAAGQ